MEKASEAEIKVICNECITKRELVTVEHCAGEHKNTCLKFETANDKIKEVQNDMEGLSEKMDKIPDKIDDARKSQRNSLYIVAAILTISKLVFDYMTG